MKNLPLSQRACWTIPWKMEISVNTLGPPSCPLSEAKTALLGSRHLDNTAPVGRRRCLRPEASLLSSWHNQFKRRFFFAGYQPVLSSQQGFQSLLGVQQPPQSQSVLSSQAGTPVPSVMVSYPTMSSYQVCICSLESCGLFGHTGQLRGCSCVPTSDGQPGGRCSHSE